MQWRTLQRGLAFRRAGRPRNAAEFLEGMTPRKVPVGSLVAAVVAGVLLLVTTTMLVSSYLQKSRLQALTQQLQSTDPSVIASALRALQKYQPGDRAPVLLNDAVQGNVINYYISRAREQFNLEAARYDYAGALATLKEAQSLSKAYEDSRQLTDALDKLESDRKAAILQQAAAFESQLNRGVLIASQGPQNVRSTLATIRQLDPNYPLLNDKRLPIAFANQIRSNIDSNNLAVAAALLTAGLQFAPTDAGLLDLQDRISQQQNAAQLSAQAGELEQAVRPLSQAGATLADFRARLPQLEALRRAQPNSPVLLSAQDRLGQLIDPIVSSGVAQHQVSEAQAALNEFADVLPAALLARQRTQIASVTGNTQARDDATAQLRAKIEKESASPQADETSVNTLQRDLQNLASVAGASDPAIEAAHARASQAYLSQSRRMLASQRLTESLRVLDLAKQFGLPADQYQSQASAVAQARAQLEADNRARETAAQLDAAKQRVLDQALADHIDVAQSQLGDLQKSLPANDVFVTTDAPRAIAEAYLARARRAAGQTRFDQALQDAQAAQQAAPNLPEFRETLQRFQSARDLARSLETVTDFLPLKPQLDRVRDAERTTGNFAVQGGFRRVVVERLNRVAARDPAEASRLRASAVQVFPNLPPPGRVAGTQPNPLPSAVPLQVTPVAETAQTPEPQIPPAAQSPAPTLSPTPSPRPQRPAAGGASNAPTPVAQPAVSETSTVVASASVPGGPVGPCSALSPGAPALSACRDALAKGGRGPEMVMIPAGLEIGGFAMMRNEASIAEFNVYCTTVKGCTQVSSSDADLPITGISVDDAQKYAAWLSQVTGAKYRLPTEREWRRAAGRMVDSDANCQVPGRSARGTALRASTTGNLNENGLRNITGNAQEWATTANGGLKAFGGAIGDPLQICQAEFSRPANGQPDVRTGFRLLREMR